jgi:hypothetical protein
MDEVNIIYHLPGAKVQEMFFFIGENLCGSMELNRNDLWLKDLLLKRLKNSG